MNVKLPLRAAPFAQAIEVVLSVGKRPDIRAAREHA
jgi:hypothetical protein